MQNTGIIECCNHKFYAREYFIDPKNKLRRSLLFADKCPVCGQPIAEIRETDFNGFTTTTTRRTGEAATRLLEKHSHEKSLTYIVRTGSKSKEYTYYQNRGFIFNLNDRKLCTQEEFLVKT